MKFHKMAVFIILRTRGSEKVLEILNGYILETVLVIYINAEVL